MTCLLVLVILGLLGWNLYLRHWYEQAAEERNQLQDLLRHMQQEDQRILRGLMSKAREEIRGELWRPR